MKKRLLTCFLLCLAIIAEAQKAYIQVNGEPGLSVYLNNQFEGKTTAELKGYIIQNVTAGNNLIKIEKEGYAPYEETINVKAGEVFAYKVKPFIKHGVVISQQGNTGETDKKVELKTGKLVVQSLPIEISITIPQIEGANNVAKTKDQWIADEIPVGSYEMSFKFNGKTITKTVAIEDDNTTSVFVNMLTGEFTSKNSLSEKRAAAIARNNQVRYVDSLCAKFHVKGGLNITDFCAQNPFARSMPYCQDKVIKTLYQITEKMMRKKPELLPGCTYISVGDANDKYPGKVEEVTYTMAYTTDYASSKKVYDIFRDDFKANIGSDKVGEQGESDKFRACTIAHTFNGIMISVICKSNYFGDGYLTELSFRVVNVQ